MYVRMYAMKLFSILEKPTCPEPRVCYYLQCYMLSGYSAKCSSSPASVLGTLAAMEASFTEIGAVAPQARTLIDAAFIIVIYSGQKHHVRIYLETRQTTLFV